MLHFAKRLVPSLAAAGILITIGGCADVPTAPAEPGIDVQLTPLVTSRATASVPVRALVGPQGGAIEAGGHRLVFPAGALSRPTMITMQPMHGYAGAVFGPHGLTFPADAQPELTLSYAGAVIPAGADLVVVYRGEAEEVFETARNDADLTVTASIPHFSGYLISSGRSGN